MMEIKLLGPDDAALLDATGDDVFDYPSAPRMVREFLLDPRHHIVVAIVEERVIGFASGLHYVHPDKAPTLFVAEVGVAETHRRAGVGAALVEALLAHARTIGCTDAWVGTEVDNQAARALYRSLEAREGPRPFILYTFDLRASGTDARDR